MSDSPTSDRILKIIREHFGPLEVKLRDDSAKHEGHKQKGDGGHFYLFIVSEAFQGLSRVDRERSVVTVLRPLFDERLIHALQLTLRAPQENL